MNHLNLSLKLLILGLLNLGPSSRTSAQSDEVLSAPTVSGNVVLGVENNAKTLRLTGNRHSVDVLNFDNAAPFAGDLVLLRNRGFNITYHTVNPLRYQVSAKRTGLASDGYLEKVQGLLLSFGTVVTAVTGGAYPLDADFVGSPNTPQNMQGLLDAYTKAFPELKSIEGLGEAATDAVGRTIRDGQLIRDLAIVRMAATPSQEAKDSCDALEARVRKLEGLAGFDFVAESIPLLKRLFDIDFTNTNSNDEIESVLDKIKKLKKRNNDLDSALTVFKGWEVRTKAQYDAMKEQLNASQQKALKPIANPKTLTAAEVRLLNLAKDDALKRLESISTARKGVTKQIESLAQDLKRDKGSVDGTGNKTQLISASVLPKDSVAKFTLTIKERWFEVDKKLNITAKDSLWFQRDIRFMKTHTFYPQVFPSLVFSDLSIPTYELNGDTVVYSGADEKPIKVAGMVNFNFKMGTRSEVPFLQLGSSFLKNRPLILIGGGMRFMEWFGVSAGVMLGWRPQLTDLQVGDVVEKASDLTDDLTFQFMKPSYYVGFQFRPNSLTTKK